MKPSLQNHQSSLAKLLAKENLTIQHGNFKTAFFDVKNRVLGLPNWKDKGKDVYDLLVGHEVGHALYTPSWEPESFPCPSVYVNVVEDVRIERMIQETYPGLIACFRRGYSVLLNDNFFATKGKDLSKLGFADRLNLKAKLGNLIDVPFKDNEKSIIDTVYAAKTWEEVLAASKALYDFCKEEANKPKEQKSKQKQKPPSHKKDEAQDPSSGDDDQGEQEQEKKNAKSNASDDSKDEEEEGASSKDKSLSSDDKADETEQGDESNEDSSTPGSSGSDEDAVKSDDEEESDQAANGTEGSREVKVIEPTVETVEAFEREAKKLVDDSRSAKATANVREHSRQDWEKKIVRFSDVFKHRDDFSNYRHLTRQTKNDEWAEFYKKSKQYIMVLVKEFELRKAAYQYSRATTARSGVLDVNKLHSYRTNDDIFLSITNLATAKNHGMVMIVDFSGSMNSCLPNILQHTIQLSMFCRQVGIPFEVYSFTDGVGIPGVPRAHENLEDSKINLGSILMNELVSSRMSKTEFDRALRDLYLRGSNPYSFPSNEQLGGTPLIEAILITHYLVKDFLVRNRVQKMTTMFLTDGDGGSIFLSQDSAYSDQRTGSPYDHSHYNFNILGNKFHSSINVQDVTNNMIKSLRDATGTKVLGFYIPTSRKTAQAKVEHAVKNVPTKITPINKRKTWDGQLKEEYKENNSVCIDHAYNYDKYFVVSPGTDLRTTDDGFDFAGGGRQSLAKAFTEYSTSRKTNKVFLTKFAEAIS